MSRRTNQLADCREIPRATEQLRSWVRPTPLSVPRRRRPVKRRAFASPAAIPDGTALDSPPPVAVGAGHARTQPTEAADVEQATHRQAARVPQDARGARRPDLHLAANTIEASAEIRRLKSVRTNGFTFAELRPRKRLARRTAMSRSCSPGKSTDAAAPRPGASGHDDADRHRDPPQRRPCRRRRRARRARSLRRPRRRARGLRPARKRRRPRHGRPRLGARPGVPRRARPRARRLRRVEGARRGLRRAVPGAGRRPHGCLAANRDGDRGPQEAER